MTRSLTSLALLGALTFFVGCGAAQTTKATTTPAGPAAAKLPESAVCPVAKETFKPTAATKTAVYKGKTYYFCCPGCDTKFAANPEKYVGAAQASAGEKKPCKGDCSDECADCANPNKVAAAKASIVLASTLPKLPAKATCAVSGREFTPAGDTKVATYQGKTYFFCCPGCAAKFAADPAKYAAK